MSHSGANDVPRGAILGATALLAVAMLAAAIGGRGGPMAPKYIEARQPNVASITVRFVDDEQGGVAMKDAATDRTVAVVAPGSNGFLRGVLRGMARERRQYGIDLRPPFRLARGVDGALSLEDMATGRQIVLDAFGTENAAVFADLLRKGREFK